MVGRLLARAFGSVWNLKRRCIETDSPLLKKILVLIYNIYQYENNSAIAWNSTFAGVPCLPHGAKGLFISGEAIIGSNCVIFQQVTIGSNSLLDSKAIGAPQIGDNCYIGAGAKIVGNVRVGHNVRIGANAVVYKDVPDNSVVYSAEQKMITKEAPLNNRFYNFHKRWVYYDNGSWIPVTDEAILANLNKIFTNT